MAEIESPMTANVWKVQVAVGDTVAEGDVVVILEAMKMEIPVEAEEDGRVAGSTAARAGASRRATS